MWLILTWLLPGLFSTSGRLAATLAKWWHSQSIGDEKSACLIEDQSWIDCIDITSRWDTFVLYHLYGNKGVSLPLLPIRPRWFHTFCPCAEPLGDGYEGMWARFGSQGSIVLNWHSRYSGTRYSGTWLYFVICRLFRNLSINWPVSHSGLQQPTRPGRVSFVSSRWPPPGRCFLSTCGRCTPCQEPDEAGNSKHSVLIHCGLVTPYGVIDLSQHWSSKWLGYQFIVAQRCHMAS